MSKLCQEHLQSKGDQRVILDDQDPHLATSVGKEALMIRTISFNCNDLEEIPHKLMLGISVT
jgi:hypothetical protein